MLCTAGMPVIILRQRARHVGIAELLENLGIGAMADSCWMKDKRIKDHT